LGGSDQAVIASRRVTVHCGGTVGGCDKVPCLPDDVKAGLCGAHPVRVRPALVREGLTIVIVFLLAKAE
jgi:hypothetical protein